MWHGILRGGRVACAVLVVSGCGEAVHSGGRASRGGASAAAAGGGSGGIGSSGGHTSAGGAGRGGAGAGGAGGSTAGNAGTSAGASEITAGRAGSGGGGSSNEGGGGGRSAEVGGGQAGADDAGGVFGGAGAPPDPVCDAPIYLTTFARPHGAWEPVLARGTGGHLAIAFNGGDLDRTTSNPYGEASGAMLWHGDGWLASRAQIQSVQYSRSDSPIDPADMLRVGATGDAVFLPSPATDTVSRLAHWDNQAQAWDDPVELDEAMTGLAFVTSHDVLAVGWPNHGTSGFAAARFVAADHAWSEPKIVDSALHFPQRFWVASHGQDDAAVVWMPTPDSTIGTVGGLIGARLMVGGVWVAGTTPIPDLDGFNRDVAVVPRHDGGYWVVFSSRPEQLAPATTILVATLNYDSASDSVLWGKPEVVYDSAQRELRLEVAFEDDDDATVLIDDDRRTAVRRIGGRWRTPVDLGPGAYLLDRGFALDTNGTATALVSDPDTDSEIFVRRAQKGGNEWSEPVRVDVDGFREALSFDAALSLDAEGHPLIAWGATPDGQLMNVAYTICR